MEPQACPFCDIGSGAIRGRNYIARLRASVAVLHWSQAYRGRTILILDHHHEDLSTLSPDVFAAFAEDVRAVAAATKAAFGSAKTNAALFSMVMPHLHWHVIPRSPGDPRWGGMPFPDDEPDGPIEGVEYEAIAASIREALQS